MKRIKWVDRRYGSWRGLVRLLLANTLLLTGPYRKYGRVDFRRVHRLVFVCQGNICRSPFAHHLAVNLVAKTPTTSVGLATTTGLQAFGAAQDVARSFSIDLSRHRTTDAKDFSFADGDLYLVMEDRHIQALRPHIQGRDVQVALLGLWCRPPIALLYDPHSLSRDYFESCFRRIDEAVRALAADLEKAWA